MAKNFILHTIPTRLPPAKLYLDDITEIWQILTESCDEPRTSVIVGNAQCDSLKDLPNMGGRTTHLMMEISSPGRHHTLSLKPGASSIHIHELGDQMMAWSKWRPNSLRAESNDRVHFSRSRLRAVLAMVTYGNYTYHHEDGQDSPDEDGARDPSDPEVRDGTRVRNGGR